ncbi:MAG TPA: hypothetical protein VHR35_17635 [Nocardioides sp.]|nr:hypothetical protein [Nocardioides sp.]
MKHARSTYLLMAIGVGAFVALVLQTVLSSGTSARAERPCPRLPKYDQPVNLDPADFTAKVDNARWPMTAGSRWVYRVTDMESGSVNHDVIKATHRTKQIADGITARVVRDVVTDHGTPVEVTRDWYAQDSCGNVWYFGEHTIAYRHGKPHDNGSWQAGEHGNMPGVALPAEPWVGLSYREEYSKGVAEDQSRVLALDEQVQVGAGHFTQVLMTEDFSPIEPNVSELKFYAHGSGQAVLAVDVSGGSDREELVAYHPGR